MSTVCCTHCGKESPLHFQTQDYNRRISTEIFNYYRCPSCGLIFIWPIPGNLADYYPEEYYQLPTSDQLKSISEGERYKIDIVRRYVNSGKLLEIGPAYGLFAYLCKETGFEVEAIEMDARCCHFLEDVVGIRAINISNTCEALKKAGHYDVIALWHVVEHLPDLWPTLEAIVKKLLPGGIVVIAAPNPNALQFRILGKYWPHVDAPRHLALIPISLIAKKMEKLGLKTIMMTTTDKGSLGWNAFGWMVFFSSICSQRSINKALHLVARIICKILSPIERLEGTGSAYTAVFRKEK